MSRLRDACKVSAFQFIGVCFLRDPLLPAGLSWAVIVSDVEAESERDTLCMHVHILSLWFIPFMSVLSVHGVFCSSGWQAPSGGGTQNWEASPDPRP